LVFVGFEENLRKLSSSNLSKFSHIYDLKTSIVGKVVFESLLEKEELVGKLTDESRKLKRNLNKAHASNLDLEQRIAELADSLKKCHDEKGLAKAALRDSQKDLEKLNKTREDDLKMIKNLHKDDDTNTKTIDELRNANSELSTKNTELAKTLSTKEQTILDLEKILSERSKTMSRDIEEVKQSLKLLFEEYKEALKQFGTRPSPLPECDEISDLLDWMVKEFQALPSIISGASNFAALFSMESLLKLLYDFDYVDLPKFCGALSRFPDAAGTSAIHPNEDVRAVKVKFEKELWIANGKEFAKKIACEKLEEVIFLDFVEVLAPYRCLFS
jgi:hypothetical protein